MESLVCSSPNEEPHECGPACGDRTCSNQRRNNVVCSKQCVPGCYCKGGYVRNATPAPTTSEPVTSEVTKEPKTTEATTTTTEANTAETTTEEQEETAPPVICLDPREIYNECGSACDDRTCDNQRRSDVLCSKQCVEGCYCRNGYVRDKTGKCIPSYRCGKETPIYATSSADHVIFALVRTGTIATNGTTIIVHFIWIGTGDRFWFGFV
uniref:TIL domain-containing protein n=1 Tax=Anopheles culicifacies TaxID=139723 RepID=A0A182LUK6_9DIPT